MEPRRRHCPHFGRPPFPPPSRTTEVFRPSADFPAAPGRDCNFCQKSWSLGCAITQPGRRNEITQPCKSTLLIMLIRRSPLDAVSDLLVGELEAVLVLGEDLWRETRGDYERGVGRRPKRRSSFATEIWENILIILLNVINIMVVPRLSLSTGHRLDRSDPSTHVDRSEISTRP